MLTEAERSELDRYLWVQRYCLGTWLAYVGVLDLLRPSIEREGQRARQIVELRDKGDIDTDQASRLFLVNLREWWVDYQEIMLQINIRCPN